MKKFTLFVFAVFSAMLLSLNVNSQTILAVDRDGSAWAPESFTDCWPMYQQSLDDNGFTYTYFEVIDGEEDGPDLATMQEYEIVIVWCGEIWAGGNTLTDNDEANLAAFMDGGGKVFLSAQDWLWDKYPSAGSFAVGAFPFDYFGIWSVEQDNWEVKAPALASAEGATGTVVEGIEFLVEDIFTVEEKEGLYIDEITNWFGVPFFNITDPTPGGVCAVQFESGDFRSVFTALSFAGITEPEKRTLLMANIVAFLWGSVGENEISSSNPQVNIYPNPAINYVSINSEINIINVEIYNIVGQKVFNQNDPGNNFTINTNEFESGIFFVRITTPKGYQTQKLIIKKINKKAKGLRP